MCLLQQVVRRGPIDPIVSGQVAKQHRLDRAWGVSRASCPTDLGRTPRTSGLLGWPWDSRALDPLGEGCHGRETQSRSRLYEVIRGCACVARGSHGGRRDRGFTVRSEITPRNHPEFRTSRDSSEPDDFHLGSAISRRNRPCPKTLAPAASTAPGACGTEVRTDAQGVFFLGEPRSQASLGVAPCTDDDLVREVMIGVPDSRRRPAQEDSTPEPEETLVEPVSALGGGELARGGNGTPGAPRSQGMRTFWGPIRDGSWGRSDDGRSTGR